MKLIILQFLYTAVNFSILGPNAPRSTLFTNSLSLCLSLSLCSATPTQKQEIQFSMLYIFSAVIAFRQMQHDILSVSVHSASSNYCTCSFTALLQTMFGYTSVTERSAKDGTTVSIHGFPSSGYCVTLRHPLAYSNKSKALSTTEVNHVIITDNIHVKGKGRQNRGLVVGKCAGWQSVRVWVKGSCCSIRHLSVACE